jgi:hypothetical protein
VERCNTCHQMRDSNRNRNSQKQDLSIS